MRQLRCEEEGLQQQPLGDEAVERRQTGDGERADQREAATQGMRRMSPPSLPRLRWPVACSTEPVARKSRLLKSEWLSAWISARGQSQRGEEAHVACREQDGRPMPAKMMPMFSIEE